MSLIKIKPANLLRELAKSNESSSMKVSTKAGITPAHGMNLLSCFKEIGLIERRRADRRKIQTLTKKGWKVLYLLEDILRELNSEEKDES